MNRLAGSSDAALAAAEGRAPPPSAPADQDSWAKLASFALPFAFATLAAGNGMGFYDSPELAAAGAGLGVTHPPGHPLWVAISALASLLPFGAIPLRIAFAQAGLLGTLGRASYAIADRLANAISEGKLPPAGQRWVVLAAALSATLGPGVFRQATRVEVYALAGALAMGALAMASAAGSLARRTRFAVLLLGLGVTNHHFIALTAAPAVIWLMVLRTREQDRPRGIAGVARMFAPWIALFALALVPYVLLPLRADALASLPRVHSLGDLIDTASARVFAKNTGMAVPGSAGVRALDVLDWMGETLTPVGLLFAFGGAYLGLRASRARGEVLRLLLVVTVVVVARAWLGFVRNNPDAAGYLVPAMSSLAVLSVAFATGAWRAILDAPAAPAGPSPGARLVLRVLLVGGPLALPLWLAASAWSASAVDRTSAPNTLALASLGAMPPRGVLFAYDPQSIFRLRYITLVEGERPDVTVVPVPLLGYPGMVPWLLAHDRALTPLMSQYLLRPERGLSPRLLASLAMHRAVGMEMDVRNIADDVALLLPRGPVAQVAAEPTTLAAVRGAAAAHFTRMDQLATQLGREPAARELVNETRLWWAYVDALFFVARGAPAEARRAVAVGLSVDPQARELLELRDRLSPSADHPTAPAVSR